MQYYHSERWLVVVISDEMALAITFKQDYSALFDPRKKTLSVMQSIMQPENIVAPFPKRDIFAAVMRGNIQVGL